MKKIFLRPYIYWFILIFVLYLIINILISGFYKTIFFIILYFRTVDWLKLGISLILTLSIGFLVALNSILIYIKYKENKKCKGIKSSAIGTVGGLITGVCPLCITGILPIIFGVFGISFSFASLPFQGIEIQFLVLLVLLSSSFIILKNDKV